MKLMRFSLLLLLVVSIGAAPAGAHVALAQDDCPGADPPRLTPGAMGRVVPGTGTGNNLRIAPRDDATVLGVMPQGEIFTVLDGPTCVGGINWWQIRRWDAQTGWSTEGSGGTYWLEPWPQAGATVPTSAPPSAEAGRIAFIRSDNGNSGSLYVMAADGSGARPVSGTVPGVAEAAWSPDGTRLAFTGGSEAGANRLYVVNADGSGLIEMPGDYATVVTPKWSPDGTRLAFAATQVAQGPQGRMDLYVVNADGSGLANFTNTPDADEYDPAWSPDGTQIAFTSAAGGDEDLLLADAGGFGVEFIANTDAPESKAAWSPDGTQIAYYAGTEDGFALVIAQANGADPTEIAPIFDRRSISHAPAFSPDGTRIAYTTAATLSASATSEVFTVRTDGSDPLQYTADGAIALAPSWSPDGEWIAFTSSRAGDFDLWAVPANGAGLARLTDTPAADFTPAWAPGGPLPPAPPAVEAPAEPDLLLIYDPNVPVFTLQNVSGDVLDLTPLSFSGAGVTLPISVWDTEFLASPLYAFKAGGCLQMWRFGLPQQDAPAECGTARQGWIIGDSGFFWTEGAFDVLYDGQPVATCEAGAGRCLVDLPVVQPVG